MKVILTAILPVFFIIILGGIAQRKNLLGENAVAILNRFVFYFAFPPLLFVIMAEEPIRKILNVNYILALLIGMFGTFFLMFLVAKLFLKGSLAVQSLRAQAAAFPNTGYVGIPVIAAMYGKEALLPVGVSVVLVMFIFAFSVVLIEVDRFRGSGAWNTIKKVSGTFIKNPLIVAPLLGILYATLSLPLPLFVQSFCHQIGSAAGPCALFAVGASLAAEKIRVDWAEVISVSFFKLIVQPLLILVCMLLFKVAPLWSASGVMVMSISTAATVFMLSKQYQIYEQHAASVIFYTAVGSLFTMTGFALLMPHIWPQVAT